MTCNDILLFTCVAMKVTLKQQTAVCIARLRQSFEVEPSLPREMVQIFFVSVCMWWWGGVQLVVLSCDPSATQPVIASLKCHIAKQPCVKSFFLFLLSHLFTNSHIDSLSSPHNLACTPLHTHTRPHGEWCLHKCPPHPSPPFSHSLSLPPSTRF